MTSLLELLKITDSLLQKPKLHLNIDNEFEEETEALILDIIRQVKALGNASFAMNRLVAKLLSDLGISTYLTRQGDVNLRMDAVGADNELFYVVETEFLASLDSPRDILDDVAVFCSRYDISKTKVIGIIVMCEFPNKRSEFWELINDIKKVVGLKIATIPLAALLTLYWNSADLVIADYFLDHKSMSARSAINEALGREINLPAKSNLIEAAK